MLDPGEIDLGGGFTARRMPDGHVLLRVYIDPGQFRRVHHETRVPAEKWAAAQLELLPTPLPKGIASCDD